MSRNPVVRRGPIIALFVVGVGLLAAPFAFSMFSRAPAGAEMIDEFRPFMTEGEVERFRGFLTEIGAALEQTRAVVDPAAAAGLDLTDEEYAGRTAFLATLRSEWPAIDADMSDMLDRMERHLGSFAGVDALPPFGLFPWFFVVPGLLVVGLSTWALVAARAGRRALGPLVAVVVIGVGLLAAPFAFSMFSRAPAGAEMIDDFRPLMTREKLTAVQGYFVTIGNGEAELRNVALPASGLDPDAVPHVDRFVADWPRINREMSPFVGVMADNLDNFAAVDALPPFWAFPWFFVIPGVLVAALGLLALRGARRPEASPVHRGGTVTTATKPTLAAGGLATFLLVVALAAPGAAAAKKASRSLVGTFGVTAASCAGGAPTAGSHFRMVQSGGTVAAGPFVPNADSACGDKTYTALAPGRAGLVTGEFQPDPDPPFDAAGNGTADAIVAPTQFFGVAFAVSTNATDPQTGEATKAPKVTANAKGTLRGDLRAVSVAYGQQQFNQGAPKPDGTRPTGTAGPTGTYDPKTGTYTLEWSSAIVGGPFDGFTGVWHLEGTFVKAKSS